MVREMMMALIGAATLTASPSAQMLGLARQAALAAGSHLVARAGAAVEATKADARDLVTAVGTPPTLPQALAPFQALRFFSMAPALPCLPMDQISNRENDHLLVLMVPDPAALQMVSVNRSLRSTSAPSIQIIPC